MKPMRMLCLALALLVLLAGLPALAGTEDYNMPYYIVVDISNQVVTVYETATGQIARQMLCSTGRSDNTPTGNFRLPKYGQRYDRQPWYWIAAYHRYVKYATRIMGEILFHSLPYTRKSLQSIDAQAAGELGTPASHGCIRLRWQDAEFIAKNCLAGTAVKITKSGQRDDGLRELLFQQSYDAAEGLSYDSFLGISDQEGALGRFSEGPEVLNLQYRLRDLGLYDGDLNGVYDSATVNAVRMAQYLAGETLTGVASAEFQQLLYGQDAPVAMNVRLVQGMSGPAVRALQENLAKLDLYRDVPDSVYDAAVVEAVKQFQRAYGYDRDGEAAPRVQKAVAYEAGRLEEAFGGADYAGQWTEESLEMARVSVKEGAKLRREPSQDSGQVRRMAQGKTMIVLERGGEWSLVRCGDDEGYVRNDLVAFTQQPVLVLKYTAEAEDLVCVVGFDVADYLAGAKLPCEVFDEYLAANDQRVDVDSLVNYVTVNTGDPDTLLNLRQEPRDGSPILDSVPDGASMRVLRRGGEWTQVSHRGRSGYLLNRYLHFWSGPKDALDADLDRQAEAAGEATVHSAAGTPAAVYAEDLDDAAVLGHLPDGTRVEVLEMSDGWCRIRYEGHEGYMIGEDLRLEQSGDA